mmetsp:Transcript_17039/g.42666  ORF Transcript_17039/g.42666 Transcript_17039/m.42666 type:complete len:319 (-) Transcript_17039:2102-3058(-)
MSSTSRLSSARGLSGMPRTRGCPPTLCVALGTGYSRKRSLSMAAWLVEPARWCRPYPSLALARSPFRVAPRAASACADDACAMPGALSAGPGVPVRGGGAEGGERRPKLTEAGGASGGRPRGAVGTGGEPASEPRLAGAGEGTALPTPPACLPSPPASLVLLEDGTSGMLARWPPAAGARGGMAGMVAESPADARPPANDALRDTRRGDAIGGVGGGVFCSGVNALAADSASQVMASYTTFLASRMSSDAPLPNASSMLASFLTSDTRMGVSDVPSRSSSALANAAADACTRPSSEEYILRSCLYVECRRSRPPPALP